MTKFRIFFLLLSLTLVSVAQEDHSEARQFVRTAVAEQLKGLSLSKTTRDLLLAKDEDGHPLSFIPDCPVCLGVQDALSDTETSDMEANVPQEWSAEKASTRTSSVARFVKSAVKQKLDTIDDAGERMKMAFKLKAASDEGQRQLARYQSRKVTAYKMMWSCLMCDAADKAGD